jgi:hypothetical protein
MGIRVQVSAEQDAQASERVGKSQRRKRSPVDSLGDRSANVAVTGSVKFKATLELKQ